MKIKSAILLIAIALISTANAQNASQLGRVVNDVQKSSGMRNASLSVCVYNITQNKPVYTYDAERAVIPASINKIFTTATAFNNLGSDFRFKTTLEYSGEIDNKGILHGNLYITGGGDPLLGSYRYRQTQPDTLFANWYEAITKLGIKGIDGRISYVTSIFDNKALNDTWQWGDIGNYYASGVSALNFHENMYFAYFNSGKKIGYPATINKVLPKNVNVRHYTEVTTGPENSGDQVTVYGDPNSSMRFYHGTVPLNKNNFAIRGAMPKPAESCAELFATYLRGKGLTISNSVTEATSKPDNLKHILSYYSNTYYVIAQYTNQTSNNMYAESIFKYLGYDKYGKGSFENGAKAINQYFKFLKLDTEGVHIVDGSGLSRSNRLTASFMCRFLNKVFHTSYYKDFNMTLAKVGHSGTAKFLIPNLPSNISVNIKTGTMNGVKSYAGYVTTAQGDVLSFCIVANNFDCSSTAAKSKLQKILYEIACIKN